MGLGKIFGDQNMLSKLAANPKTAKYLADQSFMNTVRISYFQYHINICASTHPLSLSLSFFFFLFTRVFVP